MWLRLVGVEEETTSEMKTANKNSGKIVWPMELESSSRKERRT
jgi:hypothetical protein